MRLASFYKSFWSFDSLCITLTPMLFPIVITGDIAIQTRASCQQKKSAIPIPASREQVPSTCGAKLSVLTPLMIVVSWAIAVVSTLVPFSLWSNQPMFFCMMLSYKIVRIVCVTFVPKWPKLIF